MLTFLKITNIALISGLEIEFGPGLNLLTGETGSGKSIIVDSLGALTGARLTSDLIREGAVSAQIQGEFTLPFDKGLARILDESGVDTDDAERIELIVSRELSRAGKNRIFINGRLVTQALLKAIGEYLVDIHGQGEQATLFDPATHLELLDDFAGVETLRDKVAENFRRWTEARAELADLRRDEAEKLQLLDILRFQVDELEKAKLRAGEDDELGEEKRRLNNVEKLTALSSEAFDLFYENDASTLTTFDKAIKAIEELAEYDSRFAGDREGVSTARAVIEDLAFTARDFRNHLEFSPERLAEIEDRLAEISRVTKKYGGTAEAALAHLADAKQRLENIETAELREAELRAKIDQLRSEYVRGAVELHSKRAAAAKKFEKAVTAELKTVALDKARFEVRFDVPDDSDLADASFDRGFTARGFAGAEFFFSANPGESPKQLGRVASGGEASRLMLILKTVADSGTLEKSAVFDEIDAGIGGRVATAVGQKLKRLAASQQVLCVTHQPQVASLADRHLVIEKQIEGKRTEIRVRQLSDEERVEEIARMLAGEAVTQAARQNAREMLGMNAVAGGAGFTKIETL